MFAPPLDLALVLAAPTPIAPLAVETDPALAFLASQTSAKGRRAQASALGLVAALLGSTVDALPWHALRYPHVVALHAHRPVAGRSQPAHTGDDNAAAGLEIARLICGSRMN